MNSKYKLWILGGVYVLILATLTTIYFVRKKKSGKKSSNGDEKNDNNNKKSTDYTKNIIIGDSQTPFIAKNTTKDLLSIDTDTLTKNIT
jgi:beta-lactamase regulating signal transducer with metallopeptidase domain